MGALSLTGERIFQDGFGPLIPDCVAVPFSDLNALDAALRGRDGSLIDQALHSGGSTNHRPSILTA